jgi:hypothetical protein
MKWLLTASILAGCVGTTSAPAPAPGFKSEIQNDQMRVLRVRVDAHGRIPMHDIPPHVAVWLTDADLKITYPDGRTEVQRFRAGQVTWVAIGKHAGENMSDRPIEFVAAEPLAR